MSIDKFLIDSTNTQSPNTSFHNTPFSRRQMLRALAVGSLATVGGAALAACGGDSGGTKTVNVTLQAAGWPIRAMPSQEKRKADSKEEAYAQVLQQWLDKNPGMKVQNVTASIWDPTALTTAVASGTAPSWYGGSVLGYYQDEATRSAFVRGLAADTTEQQKSYDLSNYLSAPANDAWNQLRH